MDPHNLGWISGYLDPINDILLLCRVSQGVLGDLEAQVHDLLGAAGSLKRRRCVPLAAGKYDEEQDGES